MRFSSVFAVATLLLLSLVRSSLADPVQVFILAGQSNMEGKARVSLLEQQAAAPETKQLFRHLRDGVAWIERDDVSIKFLDRDGKLTVGYGSPQCIGPELAFGLTMGDATEAHVLLIKCAWGGKSLFRDFRSPSAGLPNDDVIDDLLERQQKRKPKTTKEDVQQSFGHFYRQMLDEVRTTLDDIDRYVPGKQNQYEIAGFVWFQGWNDMVNQQATAEYGENMAHFIRDVRRDLNKPQLPFVIGQLGVGGEQESKPNPKRDKFKTQQVSPLLLPEFKTNVYGVRTDQYWDMEADAVFAKGWRENLEAWNRVGSDRPYHYLGSPKCYMRMGQAFAEALLNKTSDDFAATEFYDPIQRNIEGWNIAVDPELLKQKNKKLAANAFKALGNHLQRVKYILPKERVEQLMQLPIWLELNNARLSSMQYHPSRGWLLANGHDPRLVKHVHIPHAQDLLDRQTWAKHPYVVLHELAHAYHDQVLSFDNPKIIAAYEHMKEQGSYEEVLLYTGRKVRHYGLSNHKEYFAESTEAYLGVNDFYPFVRAELKEHDPKMHSLLESVWGEVK